MDRHPAERRPSAGCVGCGLSYKTGCLRFIFLMVLCALLVPVVPLTSTREGWISKHLAYAEVAAGAATKGEEGESSSKPVDKKQGSMKEMFGGNDKAKDQPLFIKSKNLSLDSKGRTFTYEGDVEVTKGDVTITSDRVIGRYDEQNQIETVECVGNVVITRADGLRATSNRAFYRVKTGTIELTESPDLYNQGNALSADKFTLFIDKDRFEAEGNVRAKVIQQEGSSSSSKGSKVGGSKSGIMK